MKNENGSRFNRFLSVTLNSRMNNDVNESGIISYLDKPGGLFSFESADTKKRYIYFYSERVNFRQKNNGKNVANSPQLYDKIKMTSTETKSIFLSNWLRRSESGR